MDELNSELEQARRNTVGARQAILAAAVSICFLCASQSFGQYTPGPLDIDGNETWAFVQIQGIGEDDACGPLAGSTLGCAEVGGNWVYGSFNGQGNWVMYHAGTGPEETIGGFAPHDFEIRVTEQGSYGYYAFSSGNVIWVPLEIWDIGPTGPFNTNDPSDDEQMVPILFADGGGECAFGFGEGDDPFALGWQITDRVYAYYAADGYSYADWEGAVQPLVSAHPDGCPTSPATDTPAATYIQDTQTASRPLQRLIWMMDPTAAAYRPEMIPVGNVIRFYTTKHIGYEITDVQIESVVDSGSVVTLTTDIREDDADIDARRAVQAILVPDDWSFQSGTYAAADIGGPVASGAMTESQAWADSAAIGVYSAPPGMKWIGLRSDAAYAHGDTLTVETQVQFQVGGTLGTFAIGIVATEETTSPSNDEWFGPHGWEADTSMAHQVTVTPAAVCLAQSQISQVECEALVALYRSTKGDTWTSHLFWLNEYPCGWHGVTCVASTGQQIAAGNASEAPAPSTVDGISLGNNGLKGTIPPPIANLSGLRFLLLPNNQLSGSIPVEIGALTNLRSLDLGYNDLTGSIPSDIGNLTLMSGLNLQYNDLTGPIPPQIGNDTLLSNVFLNNNNLSGLIPPGLGNTRLRDLFMSHNQFSGPIPPELGQLNGINRLHLTANQLTGPIPPELGKLTTLRRLTLGDNQLSGPIPPELGQLIFLQVLSLDGNQLTGPVPLPVAAAGASSTCDFTGNDSSLCMPDIAPYQALGDPICGLALDAACLPVVHVDAQAFLEGAYAAGAMQTGVEFRNQFPSAQPYSDTFFNGTPLDHDNPDVVPSPPDSVVDWVLVGLRSDVTPESALPSSQRSAFLLEGGAIVDTTGGLVAFPDVAPGGYYLVVRHRNHASVMSSGALDLSSGQGSWDFTSAMSQAYSAGGDPMKDLGDGSFGMFACDANADGLVTAPDFNLWNTATSAGAYGYEQADCNMDGAVTALDFNLWNANTSAGAGSKVPD